MSPIHTEDVVETIHLDLDAEATRLRLEALKAVPVGTYDRLIEANKIYNWLTTGSTE